MSAHPLPRKVAVYWEDTGHEDERVADEHPSCTIPQCSVGFEVWRKPHAIALTHSRLLDNDEVPNDGILTIPLRCVDRIEYLVVDTVEEFKVTVRRRGRTVRSLAGKGKACGGGTENEEDAR